MYLTVLETPHVIVAAAIATKITNPFLSLPLAFGSHFLFEKIPHWNPHINTEKKKYGHITKNSMYIIIADSALSLIIGTVIASRQIPDYRGFLVVMAACFMGVLPDLIEAPYYMLNITSDFITKYWIPFKKSLQVDTTPVIGIVTQIVVVAVALLWIVS